MGNVKAFDNLITVDDLSIGSVDELLWKVEQCYKFKYNIKSIKELVPVERVRVCV